MANTLPYLPAPGTINTALNKIRTAATPDRVTNDFVATKLAMKGGSGAAITPFLKKINFVSSDGSPTDLYKNFRNLKTGGTAMAEAIKYGYSALSEANEYFYLLTDTELTSLIVQVTGLDSNNKIVKLTQSTLNNLKAYADFESRDKTSKVEDAVEQNGELINKNVSPKINHSNKMSGLNLSYTINLNLPQTTDQAVFNAIFKSLKEHLLSNE